MRNAFLKGLIIGGLLFSMIGVSAANIASSMATYSNVKSKENVSTVQEAIDELYHTIGPIYEIYNNNDYELTRTLPNSNTVELYDKYYFDYNDITSELHGSVCIKRSSQVECFDGKYEEKNKLINLFGAENCTESSTSVQCRITGPSLSCSLGDGSIFCYKGTDCSFTPDYHPGIAHGCA